ncbi:hypothetical protein DFS33DRAFT_1386605 [Desarmillaria ectypa]|nr:hypothetical protein DFS33DRAFT_1386605 [Desarmillaria ectypa]
MTSSQPAFANGESSVKRGANALVKHSPVMKIKKVYLPAPEASSSAFEILNGPYFTPLMSQRPIKTQTFIYYRCFVQGVTTQKHVMWYLHKSISSRYIYAPSTSYSTLGDLLLSPAPQNPKVKSPSMQQRLPVVPFLLVHLLLAVFKYDDSPIQYAMLVFRELFSWALPSIIIDILDGEIEGAHGDLLEAAEAGRLGRDTSRALWDRFYGWAFL